MIIGYARPTEEDANCEEQLALLKELGCTEFYTENHASPKKREQLNRMMENLTPNDTVIVGKLHTFADSTRHLVELIKELDEKKVFFQSMKEGIDTRTSLQLSFLELVQYFVEFQSDAVSQKTKLGMSEAKQKGVISGRPRKSEENVQRAIDMYESKKFSLAEIKEKTGISKSTLYRYLEN